jgi:glycerol-3-phosphate acyltransferase PlsY
MDGETRIMLILTQLAIILTAYLLGCIAVGYYLVRWRTGQDLHNLGSGATGGRNTGRVLGKSGAIITGIGDVLKGVVAMALALWFNSEAWTLGLVMVAVLAGHVWPLQLKFKGGKGLSAAFGAVLMYDYRIALLTALAAGVFSLISRMGKRRITPGFMLGVASAPLIAFFLGERWEIIAGLVTCVAIILFAHRNNIMEALKPKTN